MLSSCLQLGDSIFYKRHSDESHQGGHPHTDLGPGQGILSNLVDTDTLLLNIRGKPGSGRQERKRLIPRESKHYKVRLPRRSRPDIVAPLDHMVAPINDDQHFGLKEQIR